MRKINSLAGKKPTRRKQITVSAVRKLALYLLGCSYLLGCLPAHAQDSLFLQESIRKWQNAAAYTLEVAEAMPWEYYTFRPVEEEFTFAEQLEHIAGNMQWLAGKYLRGQAQLDRQVAAQIARDDLRVGSLPTIPIVVHIIHQGGPENIPNAQVQTAIAYLNAAFANSAHRHFAACGQ